MSSQKKILPSQKKILPSQEKVLPSQEKVLPSQEKGLPSQEKVLPSQKKILPNPAQVAPRPLRLRIDTQTEDVRIELIPLIDVIFCILTFFLLSAVGLSRQQAINVDIAVPKASTGKPQGRQILVVSLNELGQIYVDKQPVPTDKEFRQRLRDYRQKNPEGLMALYASANASYNQVVQVLDLLRQEGGERVALATIPGKANQSSAFSPAAPPATGVPSYTPYPGEGSLGTYPYGTLNPAQPQVPGNPGQLLPGVPGVSPGSPPPLPGQSGVNPGNSAAPAPGTQVAPNINTTPGNSAAPAPGTQVAPNINTTPGNSATPSPGTQVAPNINTAPGNSAAPTPGTQVAPRTNTTPGNSAAPSPGTQVAPRNSTAPTPGT
jgi:biopolymer transport protein ExbD